MGNAGGREEKIDYQTRLPFYIACIVHPTRKKFLLQETRFSGLGIG